MMRKGQTEIFGLVIVVLLVSLLMVIVLAFVINQKSSEVKQIYTDDQIAVNFLKALLSTHVPQCNHVSFDDVVIDCHRAMSLSCGGETSCAVMKSFPEDLAGMSLDVWNTDYSLHIYEIQDSANDNNKIISSGNCLNAETVQAAHMVLPAITTTVVLQMEICH